MTGVGLSLTIRSMACLSFSVEFCRGVLSI